MHQAGEESLIKITLEVILGLILIMIIHTHIYIYIYNQQILVFLSMFYNDVVYCTDINCCITSHKRQINEMCSTLINLCILASAQTIPRGRPVDKTIPGWNEQVKSYQERSLF